MVPTRISNKLRFSKEDLSTFEGYKQAIMRIDNNYWKKVQDEKNKVKLAHTLQQHLPQSRRTSTPYTALENKPRIGKHT